MRNGDELEYIFQKRRADFACKLRTKLRKSSRSERLAAARHLQTRHLPIRSWKMGMCSNVTRIGKEDVCMYRLKWLLKVDLLKGTFRTRGLHAFKKIEDMTHFRSPKHKIPARLGRKIEPDVQIRTAGFQLIQDQCKLPNCPLRSVNGRASPPLREMRWICICFSSWRLERKAMGLPSGDQWAAVSTWLP